MKTKREITPDGEISIGSKFADDIGFTGDKFSLSSYLWKQGSTITISLIFSKHPGNGHFSKLLDNLFARNFIIQVPTPFPKMEAILKKKGFAYKVINDPEMGAVEIYEKVGGKANH